jgi:hypothetical protein
MSSDDADIELFKDPGAGGGNIKILTADLAIQVTEADFTSI